MAERAKQSAPPSPHDIYRGLPLGPGGIEPVIFRDRETVAIFQKTSMSVTVATMIAKAWRGFLAANKAFHWRSALARRPTTAECCS